MLIIAGKPLVQQRPRVHAGGVYMPSAGAQRTLGEALLATLALNRVKPIMAGEIALSVRFYGVGPRADLSNLLKLFEDAANGVLWTDDRQVVCIDARMTRASPNPRYEFEFKRAGVPA